MYLIDNYHSQIIFRENNLQQTQAPQLFNKDKYSWKKCN